MSPNARRVVRSGPGLRDYAELGFNSGLPGSVKPPPPGMRETGLAPNGAPTVLTPRPGSEVAKLVREEPFHAAEYVAYVVTTVPLRIDQPLRRGRRAVSIKNADLVNTIWIGSSSSVALNNGWPLAAGESVSFPYDENVPVYAISPAGAVVVALVQHA